MAAESLTDQIEVDKAVLDVGVHGLEDKPIRLSLFSAGFMLGLLKTGRFTTTQGKYQAATAQAELEQALMPFMPKEKEPSRAARRRDRKG